MPSAPLHSTLRARTNVVLACVWLIALVALVAGLGEVPWTMVVAGAASGALQGLLQRRALGEATALFLKAQSALDIRAAMMSTGAGRAQIRVLWGSTLLFLGLAFALGRERGPLVLGLLPVAAVLAQWFVRESITASTCARLERAAIGNPAQ